METKKLDELKANPKNPRLMTNHDADSLKRSLGEFGDLSGIVYNTRTGQLVGGHQRVETFRGLGGAAEVVITQRFADANSVGTTAIGYLPYNGEFFNYREVDWPADRETAANIAANRIQGDWDTLLLAEMDQWLKENNPDLLEMTGQTEDEINRLLGQEEAPAAADDDGRSHLSFKLTEAQYETVERALSVIKTQHNLQMPENSDTDGNALFVMSRDYLERQPSDQ